jgi:hypothetical protein
MTSEVRKILVISKKFFGQVVPAVLMIICKFSRRELSQDVIQVAGKIPTV